MRAPRPLQRSPALPYVPELTADLTVHRDLVRELHELAAAQRVLKQQRALAENLLLLGNADAPTVDGRPMPGEHSRRELDREALREEQPQLVDKYTRAKTVRPLPTGREDDDDATTSDELRSAVREHDPRTDPGRAGGARPARHVRPRGHARCCSS